MAAQNELCGHFRRLCVLMLCLGVFCLILQVLCSYIMISVFVGLWISLRVNACVSVSICVPCAISFGSFFCVFVLPYSGLFFIVYYFIAF